MIRNAQIVGADTTPEKYNTETAPRGSKEFVVRAHALTEILRNADRWVNGYVSPDSEAKAWGTLFDCVLLTPYQFSKRYAVLPGDAPKKPSKTQRGAKKPSPDTVAAIEWWDNWLARNPGEIIDQDENTGVHAAANRVMSDPVIADLLERSSTAVMVVAEWSDPSGLIVPVKCLIDIVPQADHPVFGGMLLDLKTCKNASPRAFSADAMRYRYDMQAAFYLDLWNAASPSHRTDFAHLIVESYPPYQFRTPPPVLSQRFLNFGRLSYEKALGVYCQGVLTGKWPSYERGPGWPVTDCADWFLDMESLFDPISGPESEPEPESEEVGVTP